MASALTASNSDMLYGTAAAAWSQVVAAETTGRNREVTIQATASAVLAVWVISTTATPDDTDDTGFFVYTRGLSATTATETGVHTLKLRTRYPVWVRRTGGTDVAVVAHVGYY